jgi:hypothetical protein
MGGRAGARLAQHLAASVSRTTLLRILRTRPRPAHPQDPGSRRLRPAPRPPLRTPLIDIETHRPVDVAHDRTVQTLADWLRAHPGV